VVRYSGYVHDLICKIVSTSELLSVSLSVLAAAIARLSLTGAKRDT
jgi:hypothetical protein